MCPVSLGIAVVAALTFMGPSGTYQSAPSAPRLPFIVEVPSLASSDLLDRRVAELTVASLNRQGVRVLSLEEETRLRESQADLEFLVSADRERAIEVLRGRTGDYVIALGARGALDPPDLVYGLETFAAEVEVSATLMRTIDGSVVQSANSVATARRESADQALEAALADAVDRSTSLLVDRLRSAAMDAARGIDLLIVGGGHSLAALRSSLESQLPGAPRITTRGATVRIEPPPAESSLESALHASGWSAIDRSIGAWLIEPEPQSDSLTVWTWWIAVVPGILATAGAILILRRNRGATRTVETSPSRCAANSGEDR